MKKSLVKKLVRMAKDGDPEAIEALAEMLEMGEASTTASGGYFVEAEVTRNEQAPRCGAATIEGAGEAVGDPEVVVETPSGNVVAIDEESFSGLLQRLDRIIELLAPAASDEEAAGPAEEIAEAVEEAIEAAAAEEAAAEAVSEVLTPEDVAEIVEEVIEPDEGSGPIFNDPAEDECETEEQEAISADDALRAALRAVRPALRQMPRRQRNRVAADIAARLRKPAARRGTDFNPYAAMSSAGPRKAKADPRELGRRIMAARNISCRKN